MKSLILHIVSALLLCIHAPLHAANYYFSSLLGDDSRSLQDAQNPSTPWRSLEKMNTILSLLKPGDSMLLKRGDIFYGSVVFSGIVNDADPVVLSAYGEGNKPVVTGFTAPDSWVPDGAHVVHTTAYVSDHAPNMLLISGVPHPIGRYPNRNATNGGYAVFQAFTGNSSITDPANVTQSNLTGAEVVIRKNRWVLDRNSILSYEGNTIRYTSETSYAPSAGFGYFIQNHPSTLDRPGEWYYDRSSHKLGVYLASAAFTGSIQVSTVPNLLTFNGSAGWIIEGIRFTGSDRACMDIKDARNISVTNCEFFFSGTNAFTAVNSRLLTIQNSVIDHTNNNACELTDCNEVVIRGNTITNTGTVPGMGRGNSGSYDALLLSGNGYVVEMNRIDSTGYIPVTFRGDDILIKNNLINYFCLVKDDGGGIYTWNNTAGAPVHTNRKITGNIILNGAGAGDGTDAPSRPAAHGIYIDDNSDHIDIHGNTVAHCKGNGLFIHNSKDLSVQGNTLYDNAQQLLAEHDHIAADALIRNLMVSGNILFSRLPSQKVAAYKTIKDDIYQFGEFSNNYYCRPLAEGPTIETSFVRNNVTGNSLLDLAAWASLYQKDQNSHTSPAVYPAYTVLPRLAGINTAMEHSTTISAGYMPMRRQAIAKRNGYPPAGLDGGALKISFTHLTGNTSPASLIIGVGAVSERRNYQLKFTMKGGSENRNTDVFLRKSLSPYQDLSAREKVVLKNIRTENTFLLSAASTEGDASIVFDIPEQNLPLYIDNIQLQEVTVSAANPAEVFKFYYNATDFPVDHFLPAQYIDARKNTYNGDLYLAPFSSAVLMKQQLLDPLPAGASRTPAKKEEKEVNYLMRIGPVPVHDILHIFLGPSIFDPQSQIQLETNTGQIVRRVSSLVKEISIDVSSLRSGHYILRYSGKGRKVVRKFIKQ